MPSLWAGIVFGHRHESQIAKGRFFYDVAIYSQLTERSKPNTAHCRELLELCKTNKDGSYGAQANRKYGLKAIADQLEDLGYQPKSVQNLKPKHVTALVEHWQQQDIKQRTIKNRLTWLRWVAKKTNRQNIVARTNAEYGLTNTKPEPKNRAYAVTEQELNKIPCDFVRAAVMLQAAFGLRREEAIKFHAKSSIQENCITLKASTCKGGRARTIPITSDYQLMVLDTVKKLSNNGYLIPSDKTYVEQLQVLNARYKAAQTIEWWHPNNANWHA